PSCRRWQPSARARSITWTLRWGRSPQSWHWRAPTGTLAPAPTRRGFSRSSKQGATGGPRSTPRHRRLIPDMISVIIPAFREAQRIRATPAAVFRAAEQLTEPVEVIVVDDGSDDGTADQVEAFRASSVQALGPGHAA